MRPIRNVSRYSEDERTLISHSWKCKKTFPYWVNGTSTRTIRAWRCRPPGSYCVWSVSRAFRTTHSTQQARRRSGDDDSAIGEPMRGRSLLLTAFVTGAGVIGGSAALVGSAAPNSASGLTAITTTTNATTTKIHSLVTEAQGLSAQITKTRSELSRMEQLVLANAARRRAVSHQSASIVTTVSATKAPATHATTGASSSNTGDNSDSNGIGNDN